MTIIHQTTFRLSVLLVTYNQEKYLRKALDSLFGQIIEGPIELIIADDASSDKTVSVIKEYEGKDDRFCFRFLDGIKNLGITKNYQRGFASCSGEYVAVLEGDDYWTSPFKLQRQVDFLDVHWESDLCAVNFFVYEEDNANIYPRKDIGKGHCLVSAKEMIKDNYVCNFSTCMYRKSALDALPNELFDVTSYDWIINLCIAQKSMIGFLEEPMSVYRVHSEGAWSQTINVEKLRLQLELVPVYDALTGHFYTSELGLLSKRLQYQIQLEVASRLLGPFSKTIIRLFKHIVDYIPPIITEVLRLLVPPKITRFIFRVFQQDII